MTVFFFFLIFLFFSLICFDKWGKGFSSSFLGDEVVTGRIGQMLASEADCDDLSTRPTRTWHSQEGGGQALHPVTCTAKVRPPTRMLLQNITNNFNIDFKILLLHTTTWLWNNSNIACENLWTNYHIKFSNKISEPSFIRFKNTCIERSKEFRHIIGDFRNSEWNSNQ